MARQHLRYITTALVHLTLKAGVHGDKNKGQAAVKPQNVELPANTMFPEGMDDDDILELGVPEKAFRALGVSEDPRHFAEMIDLSMIPSQAERDRAAREGERQRLAAALETERLNTETNLSATQNVTHVNGLKVDAGAPPANGVESASDVNTSGRASRRTTTSAKSTADVAAADALAAQKAADEKAAADKAAAEKAAAEKAANGQSGDDGI